MEPVGNYADSYTLVCLILGMLGAGVIRWLGEKTGLEKRWRRSVPEIVFLSAVMVLSLMSLASNTYNPFIYFRF